MMLIFSIIRILLNKKDCHLLMYHLVILVSFKSNLQRLSQKKNQSEPKAVYNAGPGMIKKT